MAKAKQDGRIKKWWTGLKSEFGKIIWLNKSTVAKQTTIVIVVTLIVGVIIAFIDSGAQLVLNIIRELHF